MGQDSAIDPGGLCGDFTQLNALNSLLTFELGLSIHAERPGSIVLFPGLATAAVEHVVGAVVNQPGSQLLCFIGQHAGRLRIQQAGEIGFALCLVDGRVGGRIDDDVGANRAHGLGQRVQLREITTEATRIGGTVQAHDNQLTQRSQAALQLPADLAIGAQQQNFHATAAALPYCVCTQSR